MKDINKLNKRDVENEIINEFSISLMLISKTLFDRYTKIKMIIKMKKINIFFTCLMNNFYRYLFCYTYKNFI